MLQDGQKVWIINEYDDVEKTTIVERPKGSGKFYYFNGISNRYEDAWDVYFTKQEAEESLRRDTDEFIALTKDKESLLELLFDGWYESTERTNGDYDREKAKIVKEAIKNQFNVEIK